jgi:CO/xanthine dehydrogenase Mo-binding subunit
VQDANAAEALGVPVEEIVGLHGDTEACPWGPPTVGSIAAVIYSLGTYEAALDAQQRLL